MELLKKRETVVTENVSGYRFAISGMHSNVRVEFEWLTVDLNGNITELEHDTSQFRGGGGCTYYPGDSRFEDHVRNFMSELLKENQTDFKNLRDKLNPEWRKIAESVRREAMAKYDF